MLKSKNLKRMLSIMMALVFCLFAAAQTLFAAVPEYALDGTIDSVLNIMDGAVELEDTDINGKIEIQLQTGGDGAIFTAYKLLNIVRDNDTGMLGVSIPSEAQAFWNKYTGKTDPGVNATVSDIKTTIDSKIDKAEKSSSIVNTFVDFAAKPTGTPSATAVDGKTVITTDFGFYAILQTKAPVNGYIASAPVLACLPMQNTDKTKWLKSFTIEPKDDTISVAKKVKATDDTDFVDETITNIGDTVTYEIVAELPEYGADIISKGITYNLEDKLPVGVTIDETTLNVTIEQKGETTFSDTTLASASYDNATRTITLAVNNYKDAINGLYDKIKITYNAVLNKDAVIEGEGNVNKVTLTYSSYADQTQTTKADAKVYTMGLDISKIDKKTEDALSGAEFEVHKLANGTDAAIEFVETTVSGGIQSYRVATQADIVDPSVTTTTTIKVTETDGENKGKLMLNGLNDTTYYLKETKAPTGYNLPKNTFAIEVKPTEYTDGSKPADYDSTNTVLQFDVNRQAEKIENATGIDLPVTGGIGTVLFTVIGLLLMAGAAYFLFFSRKKSN